jgi:hypothetical protein
VGNTDKTVLAVDFDFTGRPEANFGHFAAVSRLNQAVWQTAQPPDSTRDLVPIDGYLDFWGALPGDVDGPVDAIMGYCVGCSFVPALSARIAETQDRPPELILFDPEPVVIASLYQDFARTVELMSILEPDEKEQLSAEAGKVRAAVGDDFPAAATQVTKLYEEAVGTAFVRLGLDQDLSEEFTQVFRSYVSYLTAGWQLSPEEGWQRGIALTSQGSSPGAKYAHKSVTFPVRAGELLRDPRVAAAVSQFLTDQGR